jgi:hypothetical protein
MPYLALPPPLLNPPVTTLDKNTPPELYSAPECNILSRFMTLGTCGPCVEMGDHFDMCLQFSIGAVNGKDAAEKTLWTWVPRSRVSILLIALGNACTAVYVQETGKTYYATDTISLPPTVPAGSVLIAQYTEDVQGMYRAPRVLVYDVAAWGTGTLRHQYEDLRAVNPEDRYRILREDFDCLVSKGCAILLQWVGYREGAQQFLDGGVNVGHEVSTLLQLSTENALRPLWLHTDV